MRRASSPPTMKSTSKPQPPLPTFECDRSDLFTKNDVHVMTTTASPPRSNRRTNTMESYATAAVPPALQPRPTLAHSPSSHTRYVNMLLHLDEIPRLHNILASIFTWILLAGFIVFPGTFTSFKNSAAFQSASSDDTNNVVEHQILSSVSHIGLLWVAVACCIIGGLGMSCLWIRWRANYVWLVNRIFLPGCLNSVAGLLTTLINVYTAQKGVFSVTAKITAIVTGAATGVLAGLFLLYNNWILERVRASHERELSSNLARPFEYDSKNNTSSLVEETKMEKVRRKAHEPALEPGSVV